MNGCVVDNTATMDAAIEDAGLSYPVVVKAQVQIGGRGKAGGIRFADTPAQAKEHCENLLHSQLRGYEVNQLLIVEKSENNKAEWYLSIMLDRMSKRPILIFSANGGVEIEQTAKDDPDKIVKLAIDPFVGIKDYMASYLLSKSGMDMAYKPQLTAMLQKLYALFMDYSCMLVEINPLVVSAEDKLVALDGKIDIDDSALFRLPDIQAFAASLQPDDPLINEAAKFNFLYIPVEAGGTIAVMSNGSGMLMSCIDLISKEGMKVGAVLDLGGGATADRIKEAMRILLETPGVKAVLINIFGGITRCNEVAGGIKLALEGKHADKIVVVRMEGTNKEQGLQIISSIQDVDIVSVPGLRECVKALMDRRDQL
jgi:succinyl-CoA synthetase beta subunit